MHALTYNERIGAMPNVRGYLQPVSAYVLYVDVREWLDPIKHAYQFVELKDKPTSDKYGYLKR